MLRSVVGRDVRLSAAAAVDDRDLVRLVVDELIGPGPPTPTEVRCIGRLLLPAAGTDVELPRVMQLEVVVVEDQPVYRGVIGEQLDIVAQGRRWPSRSLVYFGPGVGVDVVGPHL